ncbi:MULTISPECIES: YncE family protein [Aurantimonadaceae]|uniref:40-residue YVTN family beta-propeller repeat-containing protein n=2 Tax=Pseudomonadota TaxID=1224 RepID=A0ABY7BX43_9HYPH|nr:MULTISPECIES: hypothetical protein [Aurantimonadaceae]MCC4299053.1 hypothetical protein [Aurantimonas coralicida]WAP68401.1 hypothetical protein OH818_24250 [Jiella pelagia]
MMNRFPNYPSSKTIALPVRGVQFYQHGLVALAASALMVSSFDIAQAKTAPFDRGSFVYTAGEHGNTISAIDLAAGSVVTTPIPVSPHDIQITADGTRFLAVGEPEEGHGHGES